MLANTVRREHELCNFVVFHMKDNRTEMACRVYGYQNKRKTEQRADTISG